MEVVRAASDAPGTGPPHGRQRGRAWLLALLLGLLVPPALAPAVAQVPTPRLNPWADEILYFVLIDRFADGDADNNARVDRRNPGGWHGGDLKGLTRQLDELKDLGITALWINPVQQQQRRGMVASAPPKMGLPQFQHEPFHGYWIDDFEAIDPQFGTLADLKTLVDEAHQRGIKVLLDVVYNHTGYLSAYAARRTSTGESWLRVGEGNCEIAPMTCAVGGLPDLKTELPEVREFLLRANIALARASGADGFRLDTYKHVDSAFWAEHRRRTRAELGEPFFLLAEYWGGDRQSLDPFFERDEVDAGFDFGFKGSCEGWVSGRGRSVAYAAYLRSRHAVRPGYVLAHYLSSHDEPMALGNLGGDRARFRVCAALQMTSLGMPVIYYGEEVARGGHEWPLNRTDMPWGGRDVQPGKGVPRDEAMRGFYQRLIRIRQRHRALRHGDFTMLTQPPDAALAFARRDAFSDDHVIVLANREDRVVRADVATPPSWPMRPSRDALSGEPVAVVEGRLQIEVAPKSVRIVVPEDGANAPTSGRP